MKYTPASTKITVLCNQGREAETEGAGDAKKLRCKGSVLQAAVR
jgi:hypothetical protein